MLPSGYTNHNRLRDYSSLFSRNQVLSWFNNDFSSIYAKIIRYDWQLLNKQNWTYLKYLKKIYKTIEREYQNEYVLKNSFLNQWLREQLGGDDSVIFNEYRVGKAIADLVMFNGVSKAFEIKTELDSNSRLLNQLENYKKAFNEVYIIVPESKLNLYNKVESDVGIITFKKDNKNKFTLIRKAKQQLLIDAKVIMNMLHSKEYKALVKSYYGMLPIMTSFNQYDICSKLMSQIPNLILNKLYLKTMKSRKPKNHISYKSHKEFNQLSLALNLSKHQYDKLLLNLKQTINIE